jgi:arginyl-tRNA--protein-N-Asp/Glu arginylyltransferase
MPPLHDGGNLPYRNSGPAAVLDSAATRARAGAGGTPLGQNQNARFYYSTPAPCPYLPGHVERRIFADVSGPNATERYELLSEAGFRRSLGFAYRPACPGCNACVPVRIPVHRFDLSRGWRRVLKTNADLKTTREPARATDEQYALFRRYQAARHGDGDMARMDAQDYRTMLEVGAIDSFVLAVRDPGGRLVGACLTDRMLRGLSAVYSFFDPEEDRRSLGSFMILKLIEEARTTDREHVYLGFWIEHSRKMAYKARFRPLEALGREGWDVLDVAAAE